MSSQNLPVQTPQDTINQTAELIRRLGDLSAYLDAVNGHTITLKHFTSRPACSTLPPRTVLNAAVPDARLELALAAVEVLDRALEDGGEIEYDRIRAACLTPGTWTVDPMLTQNVGALGPSDVEPPFTDPSLTGPLPRLGPEAIKLAIAGIRQSKGDLSIYLADTQNGNEVAILTFDAKVAYKLPEPTGLAEEVPKNRRGRATNSLKKLNEAFNAGTRLQYTPIPAPVTP